MALQIGDPAGIVHLSVRAQHVGGTQTVFRDDHGQAVFPVILVEHQTQPHGIDLRAVLAGLQKGISLVPEISELVEIHLVAPKLPLPRRVGRIGRKVGGAQGPVVVYPQIVDPCACKQRPVPGPGLRHDIPLLEIAQVITRITPGRVHFQGILRLEPVVAAGGPHIPGIRGGGVGAGGGYGRTHKRARRQLPAGPDGQGVGQKHVVVHLRPLPVRLPGILCPDIHALVHPDHQILLIVHLPVFHPVPVTRKTDSRVPLKGVDAFPALPAIVLLHQAVGKVKMVQRHKRFDAVIFQPVDDLVVEFQSGLIDRAVPVGNNPGPGQGKPVRLQPQPGE